MVRSLPLIILLVLVAAGCGSGEAKVQEDTASVRKIGAAGGTLNERIQAIQNSSLPDDIKAKKIATLRSGG